MHSDWLKLVTWLLKSNHSVNSREKCHASPVWPKKLPNVYKSCMKMISLEKLPKNVGALGKIIVSKGFEKLPKVH